MNQPEDNTSTSPVTAGPVIALHYSGRDSAQVVLQGGQPLAQRISALAQQLGIPNDIDPGLASTLARVELSQEIPQELYVAAAQLLAFVWRITAD
jgi:flagellar biosynthesis protein